MYISVVLPVYNAEETVAEAIDSILQQTFMDFELIIINDGSIDNSEEIILSYSDERIRYYSNGENRGLIYSLNRGLRLAKGKYIARMDADDISLPERFEKQVRIMEDKPHVIVCGTLVKYFGSTKCRLPFTAYEDSGLNKEKLLLGCCFAHPTVMIRRQILVDTGIVYHDDYLHAEDYKMWIDLAAHGDFYNIQEVLLKYRLSATQISQNSNLSQIEYSIKCRREYIEKNIGKNYIEHPITLKTIRETYQYMKFNKYMLQVVYMSLEHYRLKEFLYYAFSLDWMRLNMSANLSILKRFAGNRYPLI